MYAEMLDEEETALLFQTVSIFLIYLTLSLFLVQNAFVAYG